MAIEHILCLDFRFMTNLLIDILKTIHREPISQAQLCQKLAISKSQINKLVANLVTPGLISKHKNSEYAQEQGRPRQYLQVSENLPYYSLLMIHTTWMSRIYIYRYGKQNELGYIDTKICFDANEFINEINYSIDNLCLNTGIPRKEIISFVISTQGTIEQGEDGIMHCNNVLHDENISLAGMVREKTGIRTFIYNFAYAHMLKLLHSSSLDTDYAMAILCGEGSVALGIFFNGQIMLGRNNTLPECSHLPFKYGFEKSLGRYGKHTEDALLFAISSVAPIYNINHVIVAGSCFDEHLDSIYRVTQKLKSSADPLLKQLTIEYRGKDIEDYMEELIFLSFDALVDVLNPQMQKRSLEDYVDSKIKKTSN